MSNDPFVHDSCTICGKISCACKDSKERHCSYCSILNIDPPLDSQGKCSMCGEQVVPKGKSRTLRLWYEIEKENGQLDHEWIDIDITHCVNLSGKFDPERFFDEVSLITEEDMDKYDRIGIA